MASSTLHSSRNQQFRRKRSSERNLCSFGVYTLILTPLLLALSGICLLGIPGGDRKKVAKPESWPPNEKAVSAAKTASTEARTANGKRLQVFRFTAEHHANAKAVQKFSAANVHSGTNEAQLVRQFILSLGPDEAIAPRDLAKSLHCAQAAVLEAASALDAYISLSIDDEIGSYIAHPQIVAQYRADDDLGASSWAGNPAPGDLSLPPQDPAMPGAGPSAMPAEFPPLAP